MLKKQIVEWLIGELLNNTNKNIVINVIYDKDNAKIYLNGEKIATISGKVNIFNFPLTDEQIIKLAELTRKWKP